MPAEIISTREMCDCGSQYTLHRVARSVSSTGEVLTRNLEVYICRRCGDAWSVNLDNEVKPGS